MPQHAGLITNTLECSHTTWLGLMARLGSAGKTTQAITFAAAAAAAIGAVDPLYARVRPCAPANSSAVCTALPPALNDARLCTGHTALPLAA